MSTTESIGHVFTVHAPAYESHHGDGPKRWLPYQARRPDPRASQSLSELLNVAPGGSSAVEAVKWQFKRGAALSGIQPPKGTQTRRTGKPRGGTHPTTPHKQFL